MVYPVSRSMNGDLAEGMSDGKYKKICPNRGGITESDLAAAERWDLDDVWYGIHEAPVKRLPDTTVEARSEHYAATKAPQIGV